MQVYKAAKYIRLSYTDDKSNESNSVCISFLCMFAFSKVEKEDFA